MNRDDEELPTEEEMIALARLTIFGNDRKRENEKAKDELENGKVKKH